MRTAMFVAFAATMIGVLVAVWFNRESAQIVTAAVPVAFGAFSALFVVFALAKPESIQRTFPVTFVVQRGDMLPVFIPNRPVFPDFSRHFIEEARKRNPKLLTDLTDPDLSLEVFHELLQSLIVKAIAQRHHGSWRIEFDQFETATSQQLHYRPAPDAARFKSKVLSGEQVEHVLDGNRFARAELLVDFDRLVLPPGADVKVRKPVGTSDGEIRVENPFCDLTIRTASPMWMTGLGGYTAMTDLTADEAQREFRSIQFTVRAKATFSRFRPGHPDMPAHVDWATEIIQGLAQQFDEESIWRRTRESFMLRQHMTLTPVPTAGQGKKRRGS